MIVDVSAEDFLNSGISAVEQRAFVLATTLFQEEDTTTVLNSGEIAGIVIYSSHCSCLPIHSNDYSDCLQL